jgi:hypothetical protein
MGFPERTYNFLNLFKFIVTRHLMSIAATTATMEIVESQQRQIEYKQTVAKKRSRGNGLPKKRAWIRHFHGNAITESSLRPLRNRELLKTVFTKQFEIRLYKGIESICRVESGNSH